MSRTIEQAARELCLSFPEAQVVPSHGFPDFQVGRKSFASYVVNHHGDGHVALWLNAPAGAQEHYVKSEPKYFFVPPYVGPRGWLGVELNTGIAWTRVAALARQAYEKVAPVKLVESISETQSVRPPTARMTASEVDPLRAPGAQALLRRFRKLCLGLPEAVEAVQFGSPVWRAGRKTFAWVHVVRPASRRDHPRIQFLLWVGVAAQGFMTADPRFEVPPYLGHNGWIALNVGRNVNWGEVEGLVQGSYRHFALQRMLRAMDNTTSATGDRPRRGRRSPIR